MYTVWITDILGIIGLWTNGIMLRFDKRVYDFIHTRPQSENGIGCLRPKRVANTLPTKKVCSQEDSTEWIIFPPHIYNL